MLSGWRWGTTIFSGARLEEADLVSVDLASRRPPGREMRLAVIGQEERMAPRHGPHKCLRKQNYKRYLQGERETFVPSGESVS
jgi:hypothetical protein